jgi:hypothetical protein
MAQEANAHEANAHEANEGHVGVREASASEAGAPDAPLVPTETLASQAAGWDASRPMTAMDRLAATAQPRRQSMGLTAAWILTVFVLLAAVAATVIWREAAVRTWPPIGRILGSAGESQKTTTPSPAEPRAKPRNEPGEKP